MRSIWDLTKNSTTVVILIYSTITIVLMCAAFSAGKDIGYTKGIVAGTSSEYINGVGDGLNTCLETILEKANNMNRRYVLPPKNEKEETL